MCGHAKCINKVLKKYTDLKLTGLFHAMETVYVFIRVFPDTLNVEIFA